MLIAGEESDKSLLVCVYMEFRGVEGWGFNIQKLIV
jgi:hypothetical protein